MVEKSHTAAGQEEGWWPHAYRPLRNIGQRIADFFAPHADAAATEDEYEVNIELPGVSADNIEVSVHENTLTVRGEKRFQREEKGRTFFFSEREYGAFQRSFRLPPDAALDQVTADFKDGILTVKAPKSGPPSDVARRIQVRSA